jgi:phosphonoacetaldehyde hydrolase
MKLGLYPLARVVKIGDTVADIDEGRNAGTWTIGLTRCGNELGLSPAEVAALPPAELQQRLSVAAARLRTAGAHYVVESIADTVPLIEDINRRLAAGEVP